ncbi:MAG: zinc ribbon domain-containing protein [Lachnospiraceae bacterium]|nr:zinc ribbon domain-containing protein [Lachnospiraceae bacterium]
MNCPICNTEVGDNYKFCTKCGLRLAPAVRMAAKSEVQEAPKAAASVEAPKATAPQAQAPAAAPAPRAIPPVPVQPWKTESAPEPATQKSKKAPSILVAAIATIVVVAGGILIFGKDNEPAVSAAPTTPAETAVYDASEDTDEVYEASEDLDEEESTASVNTSVTYDDEEEDEDEDVAPVSTTSSASYEDEEDEDEDDGYIAPAPAASKTTVTSSSYDDEEWPEE